MLQRHVRQLLAVAFAISVFTGMSVAPVAASESVDIGGDSGISIGTDGIGIGGDDGIQIGADPEDGVNASVGGDEGVTVGASPDDGAEVGVGDGVEVEAGPDDGANVRVGEDGIAAGTDGVRVGEADLTEGEADELAPQVGNLSEGDTGFDEFDGGLEDTETPDLPTEPTDLDVDTNDVPEEQRPLTQLLQSLPETEETGPEDVPIGGENATVNVCEPLDLGPQDLPVGALPSLGDLPDGLQPPGVPASLITPEAVLGIVLGIAPAPCEVVNPNDPQIDPTDPPDEPRGTLDVARFGEYNDGGVGLVYYEGTLDDSEGGPSIDGMSGLLLTPEYGDVDQKLVLDDGRNDYGLDPRFRYNEDGVEYEAILILLGKQAGVEGGCENLEEYDGDLSVDSLEENPLGPCEYSLVGLPNLFGPGDLVAILTGLGEREEPPVNLDALPVNPDALLNL